MEQMDSQEQVGDKDPGDDQDHQDQKDLVETQVHQDPVDLMLLEETQKGPTQNRPE